MNRIFVGFDHRQPVSYTVAHYSLLMTASRPISVAPLVLPALPLTREGLTPFTFSRFLVPYLCDFRGWALFVDADVFLRADVSGLFDLSDDRYAVMVAKNDRKFEWASVMLMNCERCRVLTPEYVERAKGLLTIEWAPPEQIGDLPPEWNYLVGYDDPKMDNVKLAHFTKGVPIFPETWDSRFGEEYRNILNYAGSTVPWQELMGHSVHAASVLGTPSAKE